MKSKLNLIFFPILFCGLGGHALLDDGGGFKRSDLFLNEPYFLGAPSIQSAAVSSLINDMDSDLISDQMSLQSKLLVGKKKEKTKPDPSEWPGRKSSVLLNNPGTDVIQAFQENLDGWKKEVEDFNVDNAVQSVAEEIANCVANCKGVDILSEKWGCIMDCSVQNKVPWSQVSDILFLGIKTLCHTLNTFYTKFTDLRVTNLETFQAVMNKIEAPMPVSSNVPLRTMLAILIKDVFTVMSPFRSLLAKIKAELTLMEPSLDLKKNVLVGANPGCAMINMTRHMQSVLGMIYKDPTLSDYIMLQGYALFTGLTKYVDEFHSKKEFATLNQGLDMMTGSTCGLYLYGATGETSNCDQYGGYPVLNMPIPEFMWPDDLHYICQETLEKMLLNREEEQVRRKRELIAAAAVEKEKQERKKRELIANAEAEKVEIAKVDQAKLENINPPNIRRRRSLVVGERSGF